MGAANGGHTEMLPSTFTTDLTSWCLICTGAARNGHLNILEWAKSQGYSFPNDISSSSIPSAAAEGGHLHILKWLNDNGADLEMAFDSAASAGHFHILQWLHDNKIRGSLRATDGPLFHGDLKILEWMKTIGYDDFQQIQAAAGGQIEVLKWIEKNGYSHEKDDRCIRYAICYNRLDTLKWLLENNYFYKKKICTLAAAKHGSLEVLKYLIERNFPWHKDCCAKAAEDGHLQTLSWMIIKGCPYDETDVISKSADFNRKEILEFMNERLEYKPIISNVFNIHGLKWLKNHGYQFADDIILKCVENDARICVLNWIKNNGLANFTEEVFKAAAANCSFDTMEWLKKNNCPWNADVFAEVVNQDHCNVNMLQWLKNNGCPWNADTFTNAVNIHEIPLLQWLKDNGCPWNEQTFAMAITRRVSIIQWLKDNGCPWSEAECLKILSSKDNYISNTMKEWLFENGFPWREPEVVPNQWLQTEETQWTNNDQLSSENWG